MIIIRLAKRLVEKNRRADGVTSEIESPEDRRWSRQKPKEGINYWRRCIHKEKNSGRTKWWRKEREKLESRILNRERSWSGMNTIGRMPPGRGVKKGEDRQKDGLQENDKQMSGLWPERINDGNLLKVNPD